RMYKKMQRNRCIIFGLDSSDVGSQCLQAAVYVFVAAVYLLDIVDGGFSFGREGGNQQGISCTDIRGNHGSSAQWRFMIHPNYCSTVGVTQYNLCTHVNQFIHEE